MTGCWTDVSTSPFQIMSRLPYVRMSIMALCPIVEDQTVLLLTVTSWIVARKINCQKASYYELNTNHGFIKLFTPSGIWSASNRRRLASDLTIWIRVPSVLQTDVSDAQSRNTLEPLNGAEPVFLETVATSIRSATLCCYFSEWCHVIKYISLSNNPT